MTAYLYAGIAAFVLLMGGWALFEHRAATKAHDDFIAYQAVAAAQVQVQIEKNVKAAQAAQEALSNAEKQHAIDNDVHSKLIVHLNRQLQDALSWRGSPLPGPVANPGQVQTGSAGAGKSSSLQSVIDRVSETYKDYNAACLASDDDRKAIIGSEPKP